MLSMENKGFLNEVNFLVAKETSWMNCSNDGTILLSLDLDIVPLFKKN